MRNARCDFVSLSATQWFPILLGYCGAYLEKKGHEVMLIDSPASNINHKKTFSIVKEFQPDLLVLYTGFMSKDNDLEFGDFLVKELACDAVIVGPYASIDPQATIVGAKLINKLIMGEFECAVAELADRENIATIRNLLYKENGKIIQNPMRPYLTRSELDAIPFVSCFFSNHVNIYNYKTPSELYPFMDIMTGRGCKWGLCTFCLWVHTYVKGMTYNTRSISNVIEEFKFIEKDLPQIRSVMIQDDTFTEERAIEFCEAKIRSKVKLPWSCYARANMSYDVLRMMKQASCRNLHVGYESGDPEVLKRIKKGLTVERMTKFTMDAKRASINIHGDFAMGFPGETPEGARKTIEWACRLDLDTAQFQIMIPFPGTEFYKEMQSNGWLNSEGKPDMPQFTNSQIRRMAKEAYRKFYLSKRHFLKCVSHPYLNVLSRIKTIKYAIPAMFWKKWNV
jgi:radical SAM superfamily enzyme YgiQ (UPF0313 family)